MTKTYTCAIIIPVGTGHEALYEEALASVHKSFQGYNGIFSEIVPLKIDDPEGKLGRSKARNLGIKRALDLGAEWLFFLDADDLMVPHAFGYVTPYVQDFDAIWGSIWSIEEGEAIPKERPFQEPFLYNIKEVLSYDPFETLQMGHFVKTAVARETLFDENRNTGEDFDYYLRVWEKHRCIKIPLPLFYNRRGLRSRGPKSATGVEWRQSVEPLLDEYRRKYGVYLATE
jgi:glycosyltransferase involved in cell wall biosynthesis